MSASNGSLGRLEPARAAVAAVRDPELGRALGELGMVRGVELEGRSPGSGSR